MDSSGCCHVKVARPIGRDTYHAFDLCVKRSFGHGISFILDIEELNWQVSVEVNDSSVVEEVVEVLLFIVSLTSHDKIFREDII